MTEILTEWLTSSLPAFFLLLLIAATTTKEIGYFFGGRQKDEPSAKDDSIAIVSTGIYGLLAFALALNLSMAADRYGERRDAVLNETNAIGTLWLQAKAVDHLRAAAIAELVEVYVKLRKDAVTSDLGSPDIVAANEKASELQRLMWGHLSALLKERVDAQTAQLTNSVNTVFDNTEAMRFSMARSTPGPVLWLLIGITMLAAAVMGYQFGLNGHPHRRYGFVTILVWTAVLYVIFDLGSARLGEIRVSTSTYDATISMMKPIPIPEVTP